MWDAIVALMQRITPLEGVLLLLVVIFHRSTVQGYKARVNDRQKEVDRLAKDNRDYRDRFEWLHDRLEKRYHNNSNTD